MPITWENALQKYRDQNFQVFMRDDLHNGVLNTLTQSISIPSPTFTFLQSLSDPDVSLWEAFFKSIQNVHKNIQEKDAFAPLKQLINRATQVAIIYGEHVAWKSPDRWSYLFEVTNSFDINTKQYILAHAPATQEQIYQAEAILSMQLPPTYLQFLQCTNGLGIALQELQFICGIGSARAQWNTVVTFQPGTFPRDEYHEITSYWLQWQDVLTYERERDHETGINSFLSDEQRCVPFAYTIDDWCFDRSQLNKDGEYPILFWDHELRQATRECLDFNAWFLDVVVNRHA